MNELEYLEQFQQHENLEEWLALYLAVDGKIPHRLANLIADEVDMESAYIPRFALLNDSEFALLETPKQTLTVSALDVTISFEYVYHGNNLMSIHDESIKVQYA